MSSLTRWDPLRDVTSLHDAMNQLFEHAVMRPGFGGWNGGTGVVGMLNLLETQGRYYCQVLLPGIEPNAIELTVRQNTLTIKASMPDKLPADLLKQATYLVQEFGTGQFARTITLPKDVDADQVSAQYDRGVLTIQVPLAQHAQPKRISVQAVSGQSGMTPANFVEEKVEQREQVQVN